MNISVYFLFVIAVVRASEYLPPRSFCGSINRFCKNHPFCGPPLETKRTGTTPTKTAKPYSSTRAYGYFETSTAKKVNQRSRRNSKPQPPTFYNYDPFEKEKFARMVNYMRNEVACGSPALVNFNNGTLPKAAKMQQVEWDEELAWGAELFLKAPHTPPECLITPRYRNLGIVKQENAKFFKYEHYSKLSHFLVDTFPSFMFFSTQHNDIFADKDTDFLSPNVYDKHYNMRQMSETHGDVKKAKDLVNIIYDSVNGMGCATLHKSNDNGRKTLDTLCLFGEKKPIGSTVYKGSKEAGSECEKLHPEMKCLCTSTEERTTIKPVANESTNVPIRPYKMEVHHHHLQRPTCPTYIKIWSSTTTVIPYCDEEETSRSGIHLPDTFYVVLIKFFIQKIAKTIYFG